MKLNETSNETTTLIVGLWPKSQRKQTTQTKQAKTDFLQLLNIYVGQIYKQTKQRIYSKAKRLQLNNVENCKHNQPKGRALKVYIE